MRFVFFEWTPIFQHDMASLGAKVGHREELCLTYDEIGLRVHNVDMILSSLLHTIGKVYVITQREDNLHFDLHGKLLHLNYDLETCNATLRDLRL